MTHLRTSHSQMVKTGLLIFRGKKGKISRDFQGQIRRKISHFARFWRKKVKFRRIFWGKFLGKSADFTGNFEGKLRQEIISKKEPISLGFSLANFAKIDQFCVDVTSVGERFF